MSITGGIKFFDKSKSLGVDGATITASSGDSSADYALDRNAATYWRSVGSLDVTTETITVTFSSSKTFNRLFLLDTNFKDFNIKYDVSGVWTHFSSVYGLDGSKANITETAFSDSTAYYEFASVTTTSIQINVLKSQVVDAQKYVSQIICTQEIGTFAGYPDIKSLDFDRNSKVNKTSGGRYLVQKGDETAGFELNFKSYPSSSEYSPDIDLVMELQDSEDPFLVWLCGGRRGTNYFRYTLRGFRLKDLFQMQITKPMKLDYSQNVYVNSLNASIALEESI